MNILKLLLLLLPTSVRGAIYALCGAIATPWQRIMTDYLAWQNAARLDATTTWQVISLQHLLNERLLGAGQVGITIEDAPEGALYDFEINIPANVVYNPMLLTGLVHKYKLYGKRFNMGDNVYTYSSEWSEYVVEQAVRTYSFVWSEYVVEQAVRTYSFVWSGYVIEQDQHINYIHAHWDGYHISFTSDYPVASRVDIDYKFTVNGQNYEYSSFILIGETESLDDYFLDTTLVVIDVLTPQSSGIQTYMIGNSNN